MKILALEFSSAQRSVAVADGERMLAQAIETGVRGSNAFRMIQDALQQATLEREQIECLAIGLGPGSYTGIRAALSIAQGWRLASGERDVKFAGVSSAEAIASAIAANGQETEFNVVIDAQRNEFYVAGYSLDKAVCKEVAPLQLKSFAEVQAMEKAGNILIGPDVTKWFPAGRIVFPDALAIAQIAMRRGEFVAVEKLEPIYLRESNFVKAPPPRVF